MRRWASAADFSVVGETGAARRAASSASGPAPKVEVDCCWLVDMVVLVEDGFDEWIGRVVVLLVVFEEARV